MPPLTIENASALVGGVSPSEKSMQAQKPNAPPATLRVKVLRQFQDHRKQILPVGSESDLPRVFALEMHAANKCALLPEPEPVAAPAELPQEPAPEQAVSDKPRRAKGKE